MCPKDKNIMGGEKKSDRNVRSSMNQQEQETKLRI